MHSQNIDYAAIKDRLKSLQPKNRVETRTLNLQSFSKSCATPENEV